MSDITPDITPALELTPTHVSKPDITPANTPFPTFTPISTATPIPRETRPPRTQPTPTSDTREVLFVVDCDEDFEEGVNSQNKLVLDLGESKSCIFKLTQFAPEIAVDVLTFRKVGFRSSVTIEPVFGTTDANGELKFTITAVKSGKDWVAWVMSNEDGDFKLDKAAYENGFAQGIFVEVNK